MKPIRPRLILKSINFAPVITLLDFRTINHQIIEELSQEL